MDSSDPWNRLFALLTAVAVACFWATLLFWRLAIDRPTDRSGTNGAGRAGFAFFAAAVAAVVGMCLVTLRSLP